MGWPCFPAKWTFALGGQYRLVFPHEDSTMEFFGTYLEVTPHPRLVWTNEEDDDRKTVTTVTFDDNAGKRLAEIASASGPGPEHRDAAALMRRAT